MRSEPWTAQLVERAALLEWKTSDPLVRVFGEAAVATYYYNLTSENGGKVVRLSGRDMLIMVKEHERWLAVANQFSAFPAEVPG